MNVAIPKIVTIETEFDSRLLGERFQYKFVGGTVGNLEKFKKKLFLTFFFFFYESHNHMTYFQQNAMIFYVNFLKCCQSQVTVTLILAD